jgi:hypothetical protein
MNDDAFNLSIRKFLKQFGVSAQRVIERSVEDALKAGVLKGSESFTARAILKVDALGIEETIEAEISLA